MNEPTYYDVEKENARLRLDHWFAKAQRLEAELAAMYEELVPLRNLSALRGKQIDRLEARLAEAQAKEARDE